MTNATLAWPLSGVCARRLENPAIDSSASLMTMGSGFESPLASCGFTARQQALAREWAYGQTYASSTARRTALPHWLEHYNTRRRHSASGDRPPITRVHQVIGQNT